MGTWGKAPWENDGAADWFGDVMEQSRLPEIVEAALELDVDVYHETVRAAAHVLVALGRTYVWPVHKLDEHLALAIRKLQQIAELEIYAEAAFTPVIEKEVAALQSRQKKR